MERIIDGVNELPLKNKKCIKKFISNISLKPINLIALGSNINSLTYNEYDITSLMGFALDCKTNILDGLEMYSIDGLFELLYKGEFKYIEPFHVDKDKFIISQEYVGDIKNNISLFYSKKMINSACFDMVTNIGKGKKALLEKEKIYYFSRALIRFNEIYEFLSTGELMPDRTNMDAGYFDDMASGRIPLSTIETNVSDITKVQFSKLKYHDKLPDTPKIENIIKFKSQLKSKYL